MVNNNKVTVVFGGTGFLGRNLQKVKPEWLYVGRQYSIQNGVKLDMSCHLTDTDSIYSFFNSFHENEIETVINLAGDVGGIKYNSHRNITSMRKNFLMTVDVVDACMYFGIPKLLTALSTCAFPDKVEKYPMGHGDMFSGKPPHTNAGYAMAKRCAQIATEAAREAGYDYHTFVPCNLYGPYDNFDPERSHFVPALIDKVLSAPKGGEIELYGSGCERRQMMYVEDLAQLIPRIVRDYEVSDPLLITPSDNFTIDELARQTINIVDSDLTIRYNNSYNGQYRKDVDHTMIKKQFPDFTFTPFSEGVRATIAWRRNARKTL